MITDIAEARLEFGKAVDDAMALDHTLTETGHEAVAAGLMTAVDLGTSAAFLFKVDIGAYGDATAAVRQAIDSARRSAGLS